ncbi:MAG: PHP domain-containing protein, partial [Candidatus Omnitrophica bacterium]|nr:PHP domain-containing protein [Candidatus Omnitrophota bacterium]
MQRDGCEVLANWRELGEWWAAEPYREYKRFIDKRGIRREEILDMPPVLSPHPGPKELEEDHSEEWSLRVHKKRDEKMALARLSYDSARKVVPVSTPLTTQLPVMPKHPYAPLHVLTGYAFGKGTMMPEEIAMFASMVGAPAVAICDPYSLVGAVEFSRACKGVGVKPLIGVSVELREHPGYLVLVARSKAGYQSISRLVTECCLEEARQMPVATWGRLRSSS